MKIALRLSPSLNNRNELNKVDTKHTQSAFSINSAQHNSGLCLLESNCERTSERPVPGHRTTTLLPVSYGHEPGQTVTSHPDKPLS